ncbi:hypothetical protein B1L07_15755 [Stenotrophomonas acidaminiphila]|nr:hypothetical protein B1L07_15755 [Stenotrophomonas acidaminiphila]
MSNSYAYNKRRLLTGESQSQTAGQGVWSIGYGYNGNGHLASLVYPQNLTVDYLPNALGQPTQAGTFATGVQYYPNGAIKRFTYGNGLVHTMSQNTRQLPARSTDSGGVLDLAYAYDANGNVSSITDYTSAARQTRSMGYDERDRLTSVSSLLYPGGASYTYDVLDNVTRATVGSRDHVYWYDANNRLTNVLNGPGGPSIIGLGYDIRGNVINKNGNLFVFDHGNRLRTAQGTDTYRYDAQGRRVRTAGSDGLLYEMYSLDGKLLWQRDEQLGLRFQHIYLGGSLVASRRMPIGETVYGTIYRHTDALGSPIAATDELGNTLQTTEHEPYGKMLNRTNDNRPGYTGHMMDKATGLVYMQQRYYDPLIPRFLSVDPITAYSNPVGAFNRYRYANNNPYKFTDPDGRDAFLFTDKNILVVPVYFTGSAATPGNIAAIKSKFDSVKSEFGNMRSILQVLSQPGGAGTNTMNLSPSYNKSLFPTAGEGVYGGVGGNFGHINSSSSDWVDAAAHDIFHFAGAPDGYRDVGGTFGNRKSAYLDGYNQGNIMADRRGNSLTARDIDGITKNNSTQKLSLSGFQGIFRVDGRIDSKRLDRELSK